MADPYSGMTGTTPQEISISSEIKERSRANIFKKKKEEDKKGDNKPKKTPARVSELYNAGVSILKSKGYTIELEEGGDHVNHRVMRPQPPLMVKGISPKCGSSGYPTSVRKRGTATCSPSPSVS